MLKNTKRKIAAAIAVVVVLALAAVLFIVQPFSSSDDTDQNTPKPSASATAGEIPSDIKTYAEGETPKAPAEGEVLEGALENPWDDVEFDDLKGTKNFSEEEVGEVMRTAVEYNHTAMSDTRMNSGEWFSDEKRSVTDVDINVGKFFSADRRAELNQIDLLPGAENVGTKTYPYAFFLEPNPADGITGSPWCIDGVADKCPLGPIEISKLDYNEVKSEDGDRGMRVEFTSTMDLPIQINGEDAKSTIEVKRNLVFVENTEDLNEFSNPNEFVIDGFKTDINFGVAEKL